MILPYFTVIVVVLGAANLVADTSPNKLPTVLLSVIARNEDHTLPHYFAYIELLDYPKDRISVFIQSDHNEDSTANVLAEWAEKARPMYHSIAVNVTHSTDTYTDSDGSNGWSTQQYIRMMELRQRALDEARRLWADYLFFVDCDNFLMNPQTLRLLIAEDKTVVAPMLTVFVASSGYSNFWGAIDENGYYRRSDNYFSILQRHEIGCFEVPMVHSVMLIDLNKNESDHLQYSPPPSRYEGELDDILVFAFSARQAGVKLYIVNKDVYGKMLPANSDSDTIAEDKTFFKNIKIDWIAFNNPFSISPHTTVSMPAIDNLMFDKIFMINLLRRKDRREKMLVSFAELGISSTLVEAVDGRLLTPQKLNDIGVKPSEEFKDPYWGRHMTMGEVGCFLSHYKIWKQMVDESIPLALVLEDDVRFESDFKEKLEVMMNKSISLHHKTPWDLIYVGRKVLNPKKEKRVEGSQGLVWAQYSYWTLGYVLRLSGAEKLLADDPLGNMVPVDEYIPIKFNSHADAKLLKSFQNRDLVAWSVAPLLIYPTHYVGDKGYISDTEATVTIHNERPVSAKGVDILSELAQETLFHDDSHTEL